MYGCFAGQQKDGHNDEMTVKPGLSVYILHYMSTDLHKMKEKWKCKIPQKISDNFPMKSKQLRPVAASGCTVCLWTQGAVINKLVNWADALNFNLRF